MFNFTNYSDLDAFYMIDYINPKFKQIELTESDLKMIAEETKIVSRSYVP